MATAFEIRKNVFKLKDAGASSNDIEAYVSSATKEPDFKPTLTTGTFTPTPPQEASTIEALQRAGRFAKTLLPTKEELPEFVGSMAGSALKKTLPGMALSAGGAMLGEGVRQFRSPEKITPLERAKKFGWAGVRGAVGEGIGRGVEKMFSPFASSFTPKIQSELKAAEKVGIRPPLSTMSESPMVQGAERLAEFTPIWGGMITKQKQKAVEDFGRMAQSIGEKITPTGHSPEVTGNFAKEASKQFKETLDATKKRIYETVSPKLENAKIDVSPIADHLNEIIKRRQGTAEPSGLHEIRSWFEDIIGKEVKSKVLTAQGKETTKKLTPRVKTFEELRRLRTNIGQRGKWNDPALSGLKAEIEGLYGTVTQVMDKAAEQHDPETFKLLKQADEYTHHGFTILKSKVYNALMNVSPENIPKVIINKDAPSLVGLGKEILGDDTFRQVTRQWFDGVLRTQDTPAKLARTLKSHGAVISEMFKDRPDIIAQLTNLRTVADMFARGRGITAGSQTAYITAGKEAILTLGATILESFRNPMMALKIAGLVGAGGLGVKGLGSDVGRKYLTTGFPTAGKAVGRGLAKPSAQLTMQKNKLPERLVDILDSLR